MIRFRDGRPSCGSAVIGNLVCGKHTVLNLVRSLCNQFSTAPATNVHFDAVRGSSRDAVSSWHRSNELPALVRTGAMTIVQSFLDHADCCVGA